MPSLSYGIHGSSSPVHTSRQIEEVSTLAMLALKRGSGRRQSGVLWCRSALLLGWSQRSLLHKHPTTASLGSRKAGLCCLMLRTCDLLHALAVVEAQS